MSGRSAGVAARVRVVTAREATALAPAAGRWLPRGWGRGRRAPAHRGIWDTARRKMRYARKVFRPVERKGSATPPG